MDVDSRPSTPGDITEEQFEFSEDLKRFIEKSGKCVANLTTEFYQHVFGTSPEPIGHVIEEGKAPIQFYHSLQFDDGMIVGSKFTKKKEAKLDCFSRTLQALYDNYIGQYHSRTVLGDDKTFPELIKHAVRAKFVSLVKEDPRLLKAERVLAGIVMFNSADRTLQVVALGTGNKNIRGCYLSTEGQAVNDCHAEIVTRRSFVRFLYSRVALHLKTGRSILFEASSGKLEVRPNISFHLYINTAPCGDSRVYDRPGAVVNTEDKNCRKLRFKIENGMGAVLGTEEDNPYYNPQTIDGLMAGDRLKTMSCTDKILRWNYLGLQGALLGHFVKPIYLSSLVIGDAKDIVRIQRGIDARLAGIAPTSSFAHHSPTVCAGQVEAEVNPTMNNNLSINWNLADDSIEALDTVKGLVKGDLPSRLSKKQLGLLFKQICASLGQPLPYNYTYLHSKLANTKHGEAVEKFNEWIKSKNLGYWHNKPSECESFLL